MGNSRLFKDEGSLAKGEKGRYIREGKYNILIKWSP